MQQENKGDCTVKRMYQIKAGLAIQAMDLAKDKQELQYLLTKIELASLRKLEGKTIEDFL